MFEKLRKTEPADYAKCKWDELKSIINECDLASVGIGTYYRHFGIHAISKLDQVCYTIVSCQSLKLVIMSLFRFISSECQVLCSDYQTYQG